MYYSLQEVVLSWKVGRGLHNTVASSHSFICDITDGISTLSRVAPYCQKNSSHKRPLHMLIYIYRCKIVIQTEI